MVKIKKGNQTIIVPFSTYKNHYEKSGWRILKKANTNKEKANQEKEPESVPENTNGEPDEEDDGGEPWDERMDLNSMSMSELQSFAAQNNLDVSEARNKKQVMSLIESALNS